MFDILKDRNSIVTNQNVHKFFCAKWVNDMLGWI